MGSVFVLVFVVVQLVALTRHEHHIVAVVDLHHVPKPRSSDAADPTAGTTAPRKQLDKLPLHQQGAAADQEPAQQAAAATTTATAAPAAKAAAPATDLEDAYVPAGRYKQRLQQLESGPHGEQLLSAQYAPLRIPHCSSHMPRHWAPCVKIPGVRPAQHAQQLSPVQPCSPPCSCTCCM